MVKIWVVYEIVLDSEEYEWQQFDMAFTTLEKAQAYVNNQTANIKNGIYATKQKYEIEEEKLV